MLGKAFCNLLGDVIFSTLLLMRLDAVDIVIPIGTDWRLLNIKSAADIISEQKFGDITHVTLTVSEIADAVNAVEVDVGIGEACGRV